MTDNHDASSDAQNSSASQETLTLDGVIYRISDLPDNAILFLNDLIRCENEANEHRFRLRQLAGAQQGMTATLKAVIESAGISPLDTNLEDENPGPDETRETQFAA